MKQNFIRKLIFDEKTRALLIQTLVIGIFAVLIYLVTKQTAYNLEIRGIGTGFEFLNIAAGYDISISLIPYDSNDTHLRAYFVGLLNTLMIAVCGCFLATIMGFLVGIIRLSSNWLFRNIAYVYVEFTRNVPVLLQIILYYTILLHLPKVKQSIIIFDSFYLSNKKQELTGKQYPIFLINSALIIFTPIIFYYLMGMPLELDHPVMKGFNFKGGMVIRPEFLGMLFGLSIYTAAFISETVRSGIISVSKGQREAAQTIGLTQYQAMRYIILPQALRRILPPLANQFIYIVKMSAFASVIGMQELTRRANEIVVTEYRPLEIYTLLILEYLILVLVISFAVRWLERKLGSDESNSN